MQHLNNSREVGRLGDEDLRRLRALESANNNTINGPNSSSRLIRTSNLELVRQETTSKLRASSPLDQQVPLTEWMSPIHNYSDVSTITHRERSIPSTLLSTLPSGHSTLGTPTTGSSQLEASTRSKSRLNSIPEHAPSG